MAAKVGCVTSTSGPAPSIATGDFQAHKLRPKREVRRSNNRAVFAREPVRCKTRRHDALHHLVVDGFMQQQHPGYSEAAFGVAWRRTVAFLSAQAGSPG